MRAYLDHAATSPLRPEALAAMLPYLTEHFANPSSGYAAARRTRAGLDDARDVMAAHLGCEADEVVFTSGGTESCNLAVLGSLTESTSRWRPGAVVCSAVEHHAVLRSCQSTGGTVVPVDRSGRIDLDRLADALDPGVGAVSVMVANNEIGTIEPLTEVAGLVRQLAPEAVLHTDAVAAAACLDLAELVSVADLVSVAAHKVGGPKGVGALVVRGNTRLAPLMHGGPQERERRPGTNDVAAAAGMAAAFEAASARRREESSRLTSLRRALVEGVAGAVSDVHPTVADDTALVLPSICHLLVGGVDNEELLVLLDDAGICASAGAACSSGALDPSHVLLALGLTAEQARTGVRLSLGWNTTADDVELAVAVLAKAVGQLRH